MDSVRTGIKILKKLDADLHDLQAQMESASRSTQMYFENDRGHANAVGNQQIATWVFDFLVEQSLVKRSK